MYLQVLSIVRFHYRNYSNSRHHGPRLPGFKRATSQRGIHPKSAGPATLHRRYGRRALSGPVRLRQVLHLLPRQGRRNVLLPGHLVQYRRRGMRLSPGSAVRRIRSHHFGYRQAGDSHSQPMMRGNHSFGIC